METNVSENGTTTETGKPVVASKPVKPAAKKPAKTAKPVTAHKEQKDQTAKPAAAKKAVKKAPAKAVVAKKAPAKKAVKPAAKPAKKNPAKKEKRTANNFERNFSRIKVLGETLSKGRAVRAVIAAYVEKKKPTVAQLKSEFPDELLKNYGVIQEIGKARKYSVNGKTRYFVNKEDVIQTKDGKTIAVCNQFSTENIKPFMKHAKTLGFTMTPAK